MCYQQVTNALRMESKRYKFGHFVDLTTIASHNNNNRLASELKKKNKTNRQMRLRF